MVAHLICLFQILVLVLFLFFFIIVVVLWHIVAWRQTLNDKTCPCTHRDTESSFLTWYSVWIAVSLATNHKKTPKRLLIRGVRQGYGLSADVCWCNCTCAESLLACINLNIHSCEIPIQLRTHCVSLKHCADLLLLIHTLNATIVIVYTEYVKNCCLLYSRPPFLQYEVLLLCAW